MSILRTDGHIAMYLQHQQILLFLLSELKIPISPMHKTSQKQFSACIKINHVARPDKLKSAEDELVDMNSQLETHKHTHTPK